MVEICALRALFEEEKKKRNIYILKKKKETTRSENLSLYFLIQSPFKEEKNEEKSREAKPAQHGDEDEKVAVND